MFRQFLNVLLIMAAIVTALLLPGSAFRVAAQEGNAVDVPDAVLPEGKDFATLSLADPWDMDTITDVSQYLNAAGRFPTLTNISVQNGLFSATSIGDYTKDLAEFFVLYPGYQNWIDVDVGNLGALHPIPTDQYRCLYMAMKVDPLLKPQSGPPHSFRVFWIKDKNDGKVGGTNVIDLMPGWNLYKVDLQNPPRGTIGAAWNSEPTWRGLKIEPTVYADVDFSVDWIRLAPCGDNQQTQAEIRWKSSRNVNAIWVSPVGTDREIRVATGVDGSSGAYTLDTKGLPPGQYDVGVGSLNDCCSEWSAETLRINQTPRATFVRPSPYSGEDYATRAGNAWDMDPTDATRVDCSQYSFSNGILHLDTLYPSALPRSCRGASLGEADSQIFLNLPGSLPSAGEYRYLSFRLNMTGEYPIPADGMMGRWIWTTADNCTYVSSDIPYDVGWHTYTIDLFHSFNGTPTASSPSSCGLKSWREAGEIIRLRFDPNENYTGVNVPEMVFQQDFDWIRLTRTERVAKGQPFPVEITLNVPAGEVTRTTYYYTTDLRSPTQSEAVEYNPSASRIPQGDSMVYLPTVPRNPSTGWEAGAPETDTFRWDTRSVSAGEYYLCVKVEDGQNASVTCSQAPVRVYNP